MMDLSDSTTQVLLGLKKPENFKEALITGRGLGPLEIERDNSTSGRATEFNLEKEIFGDSSLV